MTNWPGKGVRSDEDFAHVLSNVRARPGMYIGGSHMLLALESYIHGLEAGSGIDFFSDIAPFLIKKYRIKVYATGWVSALSDAYDKQAQDEDARNDEDKRIKFVLDIIGAYADWRLANPPSGAG